VIGPHSAEVARGGADPVALPARAESTEQRGLVRGSVVSVTQAYVRGGVATRDGWSPHVIAGVWLGELAGPLSSWPDWPMGGKGIGPIGNQAHDQV
jgi:hypothetical protein